MNARERQISAAAEALLRAYKSGASVLDVADHPGVGPCIFQIDFDDGRGARRCGQPPTAAFRIAGYLPVGVCQYHVGALVRHENVVFEVADFKPEGARPVSETTPATAAYAVAAEIQKRFDEDRTSRASKKWLSPNNRASAIGHPCERYLTYLRTDPQGREDPDITLAYIFREGDLHERDVKMELQRLGFVVKSDQEQFLWKGPNISGTIDGRLGLPDTGVLYPYDCKSCSPHVWPHLNALADFQKYSWTAKWPPQLMVYMVLCAERHENVEQGILVLKNKQTGEIKPVVIELDLGLVEELAKKAERVNEHVAAGTLPDRMSYDHKTCSMCDYYTTCKPGLHLGPGIEVIDDPNMIAKLDRLHVLNQELELTKPIKKETEKLDKELKALFRDLVATQDSGQVVVGRWLVLATKSVTLYKERPAREQETVRISFENLDIVGEKDPDMPGDDGEE